MEIKPKQPSAQGPAQWFTGDVWIDAIARGQVPSRVSVSAVHFTPGARTAWHSHPADEWHWHGAAPEHVMTHLSITEGTGPDGKPDSVWGDHVTAEEYGRPAAGLQ